MLKHLYKKLHLMFTVSVMLIISLVIGILSVNALKEGYMNDSIFFQRMTTLLIYELEGDEQNMEHILRSYEDQYSIFCMAKDGEGRVWYQSHRKFPTDTQRLLQTFHNQMAKEKMSPLESSSVSEQNGIVEITGASNEKYWGISAKIVSKKNTVFYLIFLYQQKSVFRILQKQLPFYLVLWFAALLSVVFISRLLLKKALKPTERVLKSQKDFIASASHELKSPLAVILANVEQIEQAKYPELKKTIKTIDSECMRMSNLVKDLLLLATFDANTWSLCKSEVNVDTLLITLYESYEPVCIGKKISLQLKLSENTYPTLDTDGERLLQILNIYMDNAIHHSTDNRHIEIQTEVSGKTITFFVIDHGQGIAEKDKPYIWDRFYCADQSRTDKSNLGLGLSIADELAKMLNSRVGFRDTKGGGATFFITVPFK
ncbi:MAG: HAMP domain-containing histidine kinase [Lachnospiraceae bacterium]|nr:HAMP domain-containing histidine kinase [Lachnospiraceae bacterium]